MHINKPAPTSRHDKEPLANLSELIERARVQCGVAGLSVAIMHKGKIIFAEGFGKRNENEPVTPETLMPIGSATKAFTATAIGELVAEGKLDWDTTPVSDYVPEFQLKDPALTKDLTLVDMLSHQTGLPDLTLAWHRNGESKSNLIKRFKHLEPQAKVRSKFIYNNVMFAVMGEAAANAAGASYRDVIRTRILEPLNLKNTGIGTEELQKQPNYSMPFVAESFEKAKKGELEMYDLDNEPMRAEAAGDMYSNVLDLIRWGDTVMHSGAIDGKQVLNKASVEKTLAAHAIIRAKKVKQMPEFADIAGYCLGWSLDSYKGKTLYGHGGEIWGFNSTLDLFPDEELAIATLCNTPIGSPGLGICLHVADEVLGLPKTQDWLQEWTIKRTEKAFTMKEEVAKGQLPPQIKRSTSSHKTEAFVGEYSNNVMGDVAVCFDDTAAGDEQTLIFKYRTFRSRMEHYHFDMFKVTLRDPAFDITTLVTFQTGSNGKVTGLILETEEPLDMSFKRKKDAATEAADRQYNIDK
ncbi:hypothetical protein BGX28_006766 [Mortierella sp. GBA30]|nr:hypothetical protein BGX28_006766 [Mortierella sp. GBA30]